MNILSIWLSLWLICGAIPATFMVLNKKFNEKLDELWEEVSHVMDKPKNPKMFVFAIVTVAGVFSLVRFISIKFKKREE